MNFNEVDKTLVTEYLVARWWCSDHYHHRTTSFNKARTQVLWRFKSCSLRVGDSQWWESLTVILAENKTEPLPSVNHTTKTIRHHHIIQMVTKRYKATQNPLLVRIFEPKYLRNVSFSEMIFWILANDTKCNN